MLGPDIISVIELRFGRRSPGAARDFPGSAGAPGVLQRPARFGELWDAPVQAQSERIEQRTVVQGARDFPGSTLV